MYWEFMIVSVYLYIMCHVNCHYSVLRLTTGMWVSVVYAHCVCLSASSDTVPQLLTCAVHTYHIYQACLHDAMRHCNSLHPTSNQTIGWTLVVCIVPAFPVHYSTSTLLTHTNWTKQSWWLWMKQQPFRCHLCGSWWAPTSCSWHPPSMGMSAACVCLHRHTHTHTHARTHLLLCTLCPCLDVGQDHEIYHQMGVTELADL